MKITFYGHACFGLEIQGHNIIFDPFISGNDMASQVNVDEIEADFILLTHAHQDHTADAEKIAKRTKAKIISNFEIASHYGEKDFETHPLAHGGKAKFPFGWLKYVQAVHTSSFPDGSYGGQPGGFVLWNDDICFYHAGDTALTLDMQLIPQVCPSLDFAILPVGDNFTMGYEDAVIAADFIKCDTIIGCHFDTFPYIEIDHEAAKKAFASAGKTLVLPTVGETIDTGKA